MKFTTILYLALPALALARPSGPCAATTPTPKVELPACEEVTSAYAEYCGRCEHLCTDMRQDAETYEMCINGIFFNVNYRDSQCWQHGGWHCTARAIDQVCGPEK